MNEQPDPQETPDDATAAPVAPTPDSSVTQQHPLTQPVPQVQPPTSAPYPGQPVVAAGDDLYPAGAYPTPTNPWPPPPGAGSARTGADEEAPRSKARSSAFSCGRRFE